MARAFADLDVPSVLVPVFRLAELEADLAALKAEKLNGFQTWLVDHRFNFSLPETGFPIRSVLLMALPHPLYSRVTLTDGRLKVGCLGLVSSDFDSARAAAEAAATKAGARLAETDALPLKRLAVRSGLAVYGRNNVTYIEGHGSNFSYLAYYTDVACEEDGWTAVRQGAACGTCTACLKACPTGAILADRFLIDNERCLSCMNETGTPFPDWVPSSVHHTLYDCLKCQLACPMNRDQLTEIGRPVDFDAAETALLMAGTRYAEYPESMKKKAAYLGLDQWPDGIAKNVRTLFDRDR